MEDRIKVLLVDDHTVVRQGVRGMLAGQRKIVVVGEAGSAPEAIEKASQLEPDAVLLDIRLPGMSGTEALRHIKKARPATCVIMLTMYDSDAYVVDAVQAGAAGYLTKDVSRELLCHTIRTVVEGGTLVRSELLRRALQGLLRTPPDKRGSPDFSLAERLTPREMEVLRLLVQGNGNKDIGGALSLAEVTVKKHVQSLIAKLGASDRTHAAVLAVRLGLVE